MPLRAILFDLDGTLRHDSPNGFDTFIEYANELGCNLTPEQVLTGERWVHSYWAASADLDADLLEFGVENADFWLRYTARLLTALGVISDRASLAPQINQMFEQRYRPLVHVPTGARQTLLDLRVAGYTLGLVSNRHHPLEVVATELNLADLFDFTLSAGEAQSWKPAPGIFLQAVARAGCDPTQAVYVGDNFFADVEGARGAGLHAVLFDPKGLFVEPGCPVIREFIELPGVVETLGTKLQMQASIS